MNLCTAVIACFIFTIATVFSGDAVAESRVILPTAPFAEEMTGREVSFLAHNLETQTICVLENSNLKARYAPWSTFKIPNLLIALETGVVDHLDVKRAWDQQRRPAAIYWPDDWRQDQTLESAFRLSAAWYFQDVAVDVGAQQYRMIMNDWSYGNATAPDNSDTFWLDRTLRISVSEQVEFLSRLLSESFDVAPRSLEALTMASLDHSADGVRLHGKTGSGPLVSGVFSGPFEGWYVGWVARGNLQPIPFALYVQAATYGEIRDFRRQFAIRMLVECGYLPDGFEH